MNIVEKTPLVQSSAKDPSVASSAVPIGVAATSRPSNPAIQVQPPSNLSGTAGLTSQGPLAAYSAYLQHYQHANQPPVDASAIKGQGPLPNDFGAALYNQDLQRASMTGYANNAYANVSQVGGAQVKNQHTGTVPGAANVAHQNSATAASTATSAPPSAQSASTATSVPMSNVNPLAAPLNNAAYYPYNYSNMGSMHPFNTMYYPYLNPFYPPMNHMPPQFNSGVQGSQQQQQQQQQGVGQHPQAGLGHQTNKTNIPGSSQTPYGDLNNSSKNTNSYQGHTSKGGNPQGSIPGYMHDSVSSQTAQGINNNPGGANNSNIFLPSGQNPRDVSQIGKDGLNQSKAPPTQTAAAATTTGAPNSLYYHPQQTNPAYAIPPKPESDPPLLLEWVPLQDTQPRKCSRQQPLAV